MIFSAVPHRAFSVDVQVGIEFLGGTPDTFLSGEDRFPTPVI
jgi:hypothetical protein